MDRKAKKYYPSTLQDLDLLLSEYAGQDLQSGYVNAEQAYQIRSLRGDSRLFTVQDPKTGLKSLLHLHQGDFDYRIKSWQVKGKPRATVFELPEAWTKE